ncbi:bifunctional lysylphosphatidylglycerol flippase/synthetase MprF [Curtobacterium ammoniigenes]|uniref:bifunctional lysylphosphatidylglycerol flippase/synthetase MprF n=1 Tax=Curtobacterium ammoniigenes TaxID=395387 RepID=UPI0008370AF9|nr:DUF2156 domain-containing protein [Curtobacterium ammoniigenes]
MQQRAGIPNAARAAGLVRRYPFTAIVAALVVTVSAADLWIRLATRSTGSHDPLLAVSPLRSFAVVAVSSSVASFLLTVLGVVVILGAAERLMGWRRSLLAFLVTTVVGTGIGALATVIDTESQSPGPLFLGHATSFDPWTAVVGTITTASAFAGALWRRRIRVIALVAVLGLLLYAGHASDLYATLAALAGIALGEMLRKSPRRLGWRRSSHRESRVLLAAVVFVSAVGPVVALVSRARTGLLAPVAAVVASGSVASRPQCSVRQVTDQCVQSLQSFHVHGPVEFLLGIAPLAVLVIGAFGLRRGSRFALWTVVGVEALNGLATAIYYGVSPSKAVSDIDLSPPDQQLVVSLSLAASVVLPLATALVLIIRRSDFRVPTPRHRARTFTFVVVGSGIVLAAAVVVVAMFVRVTTIDPIVLALAVLGPLTPASVIATAAHAHPILRLAVGLAGPIEWVVIAVALAWATGAGTPRDGGEDRRLGPVLPGSARAARELVHVGGDGFAWMTTWEGNDLWFSDDGRAAIAYRRTGHVAVTLGGPFGYPEARSAAWEGFARFCDDIGWTAVFYSVAPSDVAALRDRGWSIVPVAEDAVIDPTDWTMSGKRKQDVRTSVNRAQRAGITAQRRRWTELTAAEIRQIESISEEWVATRDLPEMGFTLGGIDEMHDPEVETLFAADADGRILAVTSWLPSFRDGRLIGWTLDVMRRLPDAPNGVMEFLVARAVEDARERSLEFIGLSAAPLAGVEAGAGGVNAALDIVGNVLEPVYGFRSLLRFKAKFGPEFRPLVMALPDPVALPAIGLAVARAYLPGLSARQSIALLRSRSDAAPREPAREPERQPAGHD